MVPRVVCDFIKLGVTVFSLVTDLRVVPCTLKPATKKLDEPHTCNWIVQVCDLRKYPNGIGNILGKNYLRFLKLNRDMLWKCDNNDDDNNDDDDNDDDDDDDNNDDFPCYFYINGTYFYIFFYFLYFLYIFLYISYYINC